MEHGWPNEQEITRGPPQGRTLEAARDGKVSVASCVRWLCLWVGRHVLRHRKKETKERKEEKLERRDREIKTEHLVAWLNNSGSFSLLLPLEL